MNEICKNCKGLCLYSSECVSCVNCGLVSSTIVYGDDNVNIEERRDEALLQSESFSLCVEFCEKNNISKKIIESVKNLVDKNKNLLKSFKNHKVFFASCLILALNKHKIFLDKEYIAYQFSFHPSKFKKSPLLLSTSIQSIENLFYLLNNFRLDLNLSRADCNSIMEYFEKCAFRSSGSNPLLSLLFHVFLYKTFILKLNESSVLSNISLSFNTRKKSILRLFKTYNYCCINLNKK